MVLAVHRHYKPANVPFRAVQIVAVKQSYVAIERVHRPTAEVIVPLNREAGNSTGFRAQLLFFLDDLIPKLFDKPLVSDQPDRSLIVGIDRM